ncbi:MAG: hypothetical protein M3511_01360 [Deinococcota bacterium]|jgi:hypothetical protein|nr:hypothetical protein [Deinococcota bacterium]
MEDVRDALGLLGLLLMVTGITGVIVWWLSTIRHSYPRLGPVSFGIAVLGFVVYLRGGYARLLGG